MSKFYNTSLDRVPNSGGSVQEVIGTTGSTTLLAHQTTSTPCKRVWIIANAKDVRVKIGSACATDTGIPVPYFDGTLGFYLPLMLEIDDINELYFNGVTDGKLVDILYRC